MAETIDETGSYLGSRRKPPRQPDDDAWRIEDHVCRVCFSRILSRAMGDGSRQYRCANCSVAGEGRTPAVICSCGLKMRGGKDLGVRCVRNDKPTPEAPAEIIARQVMA